MPFTNLVVDSDSAALAETVELLSGAGHRVTAMGTFEEAKRLLAASPPDLLVTDIRLGAFNGLHLVLHSRIQRPELPAIVTHIIADPVLEKEAGRLNASYVLKPLNPTEFLALASRALSGARPKPSGERRRWPRKPIAGGLGAVIAGASGTLVDVSYGGLRVELPTAPRQQLPPSFEVHLPAYSLSVKAERIWTTEGAALGELWCGAALSDADSDAAHAWRALVDALE